MTQPWSRFSKQAERISISVSYAILRSTEPANPANRAASVGTSPEARRSDSSGRRHSARCLWFTLLYLCATAALPAAETPAANLSDSDFAETDETLVNAQERLANAKTEPDILRALLQMVNLMRRRGDYSDGLAGAKDGLARAQRIGDIRLQVDFLYVMGRIYWNIGDYPRSIETHLEELRLVQTIDDSARLARTHGGLGMTYQRFGRNEDALHHFDLGLQFAEKAGDQHMRASILNSIGNYYLSERDYERATALHTQVLRIREASGNRSAIAVTLTNLGLAADGRGDYATALAYLEQALTTFESLKYRRYIANTHRRLARVLRNAGRTTDALTHLGKALQIGQSLASPEVLVDIYQEFALTHEARGEFAPALEYQRKLGSVTDEIRSDQDRRRMAELRARYGQEQRELEITLLKREQELQSAELSRRRSQNLALAAAGIGGVTLLGAITLVQLVRLRAERRMRAATEDARARAEAAERLKSRLLQMASHDLKVPLTALNATARLIGTSPDDASTVRRLADGIQADTARMRNLVRDFLDASAIEDGNLQLHTAEIDLAAVSSAAVESLLPVAAQKNQRLEILPSITALPRVEADEDRLRQVMDNLISNALKFTPPGGAVTVALGQTGAWGYAEVRDSGPGLGPADFAKMFAPNQRLSAQPTGDEDSTGLGLFIVRELLTLQGGRLEVQSQPGRGAVFRVLLPVVQRA